MRRFILMTTLVATLMTIPGVAFASDGITQRFWDSAVHLLVDRFTGQVPAVTQFLQLGEETILGTDDDFTTNPAVVDVFKGMRVAGLLLLAFCFVISLAEFTEANITGNGYGLASWFKRFFVATLLTFGGLQFYAIWVHLFNALLIAFRTYLDTHWTTNTPASGLYGMVVQLFAATSTPFLLLPFVAMTVVVLLVLWFLIGGVRKAELMVNAAILAPLVWPVYLIPSLEDMPKTAFRSFVGLNATLLIVVGMLRLSIRLALGPGVATNIWQLIPALSVLMFTIFIPSMVKRITGQGHTGMGAVMTAVQLAAGLKFLSMGTGAFHAAPPAAGSAASTGAAGVSNYPLATVPPAAATAPGSGASPPALPEMPTIYYTTRNRNALPEGARKEAAAALQAPNFSKDIEMQVEEIAPGHYRAASTFGAGFFGKDLDGGDK